MQRTTLAAVASLLVALIANLFAKYGMDLSLSQRAEISDALVQLMVLGGLAIPALVGYLRSRRGVAPVLLPKEEVKQLKEGTAEVTQVAPPVEEPPVLPRRQSGFIHPGEAVSMAALVLLIGAVIAVTGCASVSIPKQLEAVAVTLERTANEVGDAKRAGVISAETRNSVLDELDRINGVAHAAAELYYLKDTLGATRQLLIIDDMLTALQGELIAKGVPSNGALK